MCHMYYNVQTTIDHIFQQTVEGAYMYILYNYFANINVITVEL